MSDLVEPGAPCSADHLADAENALGLSLPAELRALYEEGDGRFRLDGEWRVVWRLDRVMETNSGDKRRGLPPSLLAFGDDGTGNPFCVGLDQRDEVVRWSWIDSAVERLEGTLSEFLAEWT